MPESRDVSIARLRDDQVEAEAIETEFGIPEASRGRARDHVQPLSLREYRAVGRQHNVLIGGCIRTFTDLVEEWIREHEGDPSGLPAEQRDTFVEQAVSTELRAAGSADEDGEGIVRRQVEVVRSLPRDAEDVVQAFVDAVADRAEVSVVQRRVISRMDAIFNGTSLVLARSEASPIRGRPAPGALIQPLWSNLLAAGGLLLEEEVPPIAAATMVGMYSSQYWASAEARADVMRLARVLAGGDELRAQEAAGATSGFWKDLGKAAAADAGGALAGCAVGAIFGPPGCGAGAGKGAVSGTTAFTVKNAWDAVVD